MINSPKMINCIKKQKTSVYNRGGENKSGVFLCRCTQHIYEWEGSAVFSHLPESFCRNWHHGIHLNDWSPGCRGFKGPFPPPLWIKVTHYIVVEGNYKGLRPFCQLLRLSNWYLICLVTYATLLSNIWGTDATYHDQHAIRQSLTWPSKWSLLEFAWLLI